MFRKRTWFYIDLFLYFLQVATSIGTLYVGIGVWINLSHDDSSVLAYQREQGSAFTLASYCAHTLVGCFFFTSFVFWMTAKLLGANVVTATGIFLCLTHFAPVEYYFLRLNRRLSEEENEAQHHLRGSPSDPVSLNSEDYTIGQRLRRYSLWPVATLPRALKEHTERLLSSASIAQFARGFQERMIDLNMLLLFEALVEALPSLIVQLMLYQLQAGPNHPEELVLVPKWTPFVTVVTALNVLSKAGMFLFILDGGSTCASFLFDVLVSVYLFAFCVPLIVLSDADSSSSLTYLVGCMLALLVVSAAVAVGLWVLMFFSGKDRRYLCIGAMLLVPSLLAIMCFRTFCFGFRLHMLCPEMENLSTGSDELVHLLTFLSGKHVEFAGRDNFLSQLRAACPICPPSLRERAAKERRGKFFLEFLIHEGDVLHLYHDGDMWGYKAERRWELRRIAETKLHDRRRSQQEVRVKGMARWLKFFVGTDAIPAVARVLLLCVFCLFVLAQLRIVLCPFVLWMDRDLLATKLLATPPMKCLLVVILIVFVCWGLLVPAGWRYARFLFDWSGTEGECTLLALVSGFSMAEKFAWMEGPRTPSSSSPLEDRIRKPSFVGYCIEKYFTDFTPRQLLKASIGGVEDSYGQLLLPMDLVDLLSEFCPPCETARERFHNYVVGGPQQEAGGKQSIDVCQMTVGEVEVLRGEITDIDVDGDDEDEQQ